MRGRDVRGSGQRLDVERVGVAAVHLVADPQQAAVVLVDGHHRDDTRAAPRLTGLRRALIASPRRQWPPSRRRRGERQATRSRRCTATRTWSWRAPRACRAAGVLPRRGRGRADGADRALPPAQRSGVRQPARRVRGRHAATALRAERGAPRRPAARSTSPDSAWARFASAERGTADLAAGGSRAQFRDGSRRCSPASVTRRCRRTGGCCCSARSRASRATCPSGPRRSAFHSQLPLNVTIVVSDAPRGGDGIAESSSRPASVDHEEMFTFVEAALSGDQPADVDRLGVAPLATGLARLLMLPQTRPLTVGVQAPWGWGKSSFAAFVREALVRRAPANSARRRELGELERSRRAGGARRAAQRRTPRSPTCGATRASDAQRAAGASSSAARTGRHLRGVQRLALRGLRAGVGRAGARDHREPGGHAEPAAARCVRASPTRSGAASSSSGSASWCPSSSRSGRRAGDRRHLRQLQRLAVRGV